MNSLFETGTAVPNSTTQNLPRYQQAGTGFDAKGAGYSYDNNKAWGDVAKEHGPGSRNQGLGVGGNGAGNITMNANTGIGKLRNDVYSGTYNTGAKKIDLGSRSANQRHAVKIANAQTLQQGMMNRGENMAANQQYNAGRLGLQQEKANRGYASQDAWLKEIQKWSSPNVSTAKPQPKGNSKIYMDNGEYTDKDPFAAPAIAAPSISMSTPYTGNWNELTDEQFGNASYGGE